MERMFLWVSNQLGKGLGLGKTRALGSMMKEMCKPHLLDSRKRSGEGSAEEAP